MIVAAACGLPIPDGSFYSTSFYLFTIIVGFLLARSLHRDWDWSPKAAGLTAVAVAVIVNVAVFETPVGHLGDGLLGEAASEPGGPTCPEDARRVER